MDKISNRYYVVGLFIIVFMLVILIQLINLQVVNGEKYEELSQQKLLKDRRVVAPRGNIYDRNGIPIALNRLSYTVEITKTTNNVDELNKMLLEIVKIFEKNKDDYEETLSNYLTIDPIKWGKYVENSEKILKRWKEDMTGKDEELMAKLKTPKDMFKYMRNEKFQINKKYSDKDAYRIMTLRYQILIRGYSMIDALTIAKDVDKLTVAEIEEKGHLFPGVSTNVEPMRKYLDATSIAHVLGYVANINEDEYKKLKDKGYYMTDMIGKTGIEAAVEDDLRGEDGEKKVEGDIWGRQTNELRVEAATPGKDVTLTIDMKLQKVAMESLKRTIKDIRTSGRGNLNFKDAYYGSVVAVDVNTGEILAMASYPSYDPSIFIADPNDKKAQKAKAELYNPNNKETSAFNRALSGTYAPGSTFKPLVGVAGMEEGAINENTLINDPGVYMLEGVKLTCLAYRNNGTIHGSLNLRNGLKVSCNIFFYKLGNMVGIDKINKWAKIFGLGELSGIEIGEGVERKGQRSTPEFHEKVANYKFGKVLTAQSSIGQLYNNFTPIQLAGYVSTIANGGKKYQLHLIKKVSSYDGLSTKNTKIEFKDLKLKKATVKAVKEGMQAVTSEPGGTAYYIFGDFPYTAAAKTGTAETGAKNNSSNASFIAFSPVEKPKIAVAVVIERGVSGSNCAPVARDIFNEYFKLTADNTTEETIYKDEFSFTR